MKHRSLFGVFSAIVMLWGWAAYSQAPDSAARDLVYYVVDRSGSILHYKLQDAFREAIVNHVMELKRETEVEVVFFSDTASRSRRWDQMDARAKQQFVEHFDREFKPRGQTRLFATVAEVLNRVVAREAEYNRINVFILSDGEDNRSAPQYRNWTDVVSGLPANWQNRHGLSVMWAAIEFNPPQEHMPAPDSGITTKRTDRSGLPGVFSAPAPNFVANPTRVKVGQPVTFRLADDRNVSRAVWRFGDGTEVMAKAVEHAFARPGKYDVEVLVEGPGGRANLKREAIIHVLEEVPLQAEFSWRPSAVRIGSPVEFRDDSTGGPTAWNWDFPGLAPSAARHPTVTFKTPGTVSVRLRVNMEQRQSEITRPVQVLGPLPNPEFSAEPAAQEIGKPVRLLAAESREGWRHTWLIGGEVELQGADVAWTADRIGRIDIQHTVTSPDGLAEKESFVVVREGPAPLIARFKWAQEVIHINSPVSFIDESLGAPAEYRWAFGDVGTSIERNPRFAFPRPGLIPVTLTIMAADRKHEVAQVVEVLPPPPNAAFKVSQENPVIGTPVTFSASAAQADEDRAWLVNGKEISSWTSTPSVAWTPTTGGVHTILHRVRSSGGVAELSQALVVYERVRAAFDWTPKPARLGTPLKLIDASLGPVSRWQWSDGASWGSDERSPELNPLEVGPVSVSLQVSSQDGQTDRISHSIEVLPAEVFLVAAFSVGNRKGSAPLEVSFEDRSKGPVARRHWEFGDGQTSDLGNPTHTYATPGTYRPRLTVMDAQGQSSQSPGEIVIQVTGPLAWYWKALIALAVALIIWLLVVVRVAKSFVLPHPSSRLFTTGPHRLREKALANSSIWWPVGYVRIGGSAGDNIKLMITDPSLQNKSLAVLQRVPFTKQYTLRAVQSVGVQVQIGTGPGATRKDIKKIDLKNGTVFYVANTQFRFELS